MIVHPDGAHLRATIATACRVLAARGLVDGVLGHVSARVGPDELVVRCRGPHERGLAHTSAGDVWRASLDGAPRDLPDGYALPNELPIHAELLRARPDLGAVVHAHPRSALLCSLAGLTPKPVFGAYDIPALQLACDGVPVYERPVLIASVQRAREMVAAMAGADVCLLRGHGVTVAAETVEQAVVRTVALDSLLSITVELARLGATPPALSEEDLRELPDLGSAFNDELSWRALTATREGER